MEVSKDIMEKVKAEQAARELRRKKMKENEKAVEAIQEESMSVISQIVIDYQAGNLKASEALVKVGLAKAKNKKLINTLLGV